MGPETFYGVSLDLNSPSGYNCLHDLPAAARTAGPDSASIGDSAPTSTAAIDDPQLHMPEIKNQKQQKCGNYHADAPEWHAYIQCWPFDAKMCSSCGDVWVDWSRPKEFLFQALIGWWWDGTVLVETGAGNGWSEK